MVPFQVETFAIDRIADRWVWLRSIHAGTCTRSHWYTAVLLRCEVGEWATEPVSF